MSKPEFVERDVYEASDAHKTILAFVFLVLLPFLISLPIMFAKRSLHGLWIDALSAGALGLVFAGAMLFLFVEVMAVFRTRIAFGDDTLKLRVPNWRGPNPGLGFRKREIAYDDIERVETRGEIYKAAKVPVLTRSSSVVLKDGERVLLGYVNENNEDPDIPYYHLAEQLARRAEVEFRDVGCVEGGPHFKALRKGAPDWNMAAMADEELQTYRRHNHWIMFGASALVVVVAGAGLLYDLLRSDFLFGKLF